MNTPRKIARHRCIPIAIATVAILLSLGSLRGGLALDDYYLRWVISGSPSLSDVGRRPMDAFSFVDGDSIRNRRMVEVGMLPWWTDPHVKAAFWKPVTVVTHVLDYRLWPGMPILMHVQSIVWFALWVLSACLLYRMVMHATIAAALAGLLYAVDYSRAVPVAWLANRNAVLAGLFGVLAIAAHYRSCRRQNRVFGILSPALLALSLLSAETGIGAAGYLLAFALTLDPHGSWRGLLRLWPHLLVVVVWRVAWSAQGYGVHAVDVLYTDPVSHPIRYARDILERFPLYMLGQWSGFPAEVAIVLSPRNAVLMRLLGLGVCALVGFMLLPLLRRSRVARFWGLGMLLSTIPMCSAAPMNRHLVFIGLGAMGLLGQFFGAAMHSHFWRTAWMRRAFQAAMVCLLLVVHLIVSPAAFAFIARHSPAPEDLLENLHTRPSPRDGGRDLIYVNHPIPMEILDWFSARAVDHEPLPRFAQILAPASSAVLISRTDDRTLLVRPDAGFFATSVTQLGYSGEYFRADGGPIVLPAMRITIAESLLDGRPAAVRFRFNVPLEDASLEWVYWEEGGFHHFRPPAVGKSIRLPASGLPF
jgi:hypothetical protein